MLMLPRASAGDARCPPFRQPGTLGQVTDALRQAMERRLVGIAAPPAAHLVCCLSEVSTTGPQLGHPPLNPGVSQTGNTRPRWGRDAQGFSLNTGSKTNLPDMDMTCCPEG